VKLQPGILACLLAGCVSQPTDVTSPSAPAVAAVLDDRQVMRIGLEFLPPDERFPSNASVRVEAPLAGATGALATDDGRALLHSDDPSLAPKLTHVDLEAIADPIARETMHFVADMVATDRQRARREVGIPFFDYRAFDEARGPLLVSERRLLEDQQQWMQQNGKRLLNRPLRLLARRLPIVHEFEIELQEFRSEHVPLTEPYRQQHGDRRKLGRMSMRLHTSDVEDPVEVVYIHHSGVRVGSSQSRAKMSLDFDLSDRINLSFRARHRYDNGDTSLRTDLIYRPSTHWSLHVAAGDNMDFLSTSSMYSLFESPMDGSPGLVLYAVHTF